MMASGIPRLMKPTKARASRSELLRVDLLPFIAASPCVPSSKHPLERTAMRARCHSASCHGHFGVAAFGLQNTNDSDIARRWGHSINLFPVIVGRNATTGGRTFHLREHSGFPRDSLKTSMHDVSIGLWQGSSNTARWSDRHASLLRADIAPSRLDGLNVVEHSRRIALLRVNESAIYDRPALSHQASSDLEP